MASFEEDLSLRLSRGSGDPSVTDLEYYARPENYAGAMTSVQQFMFAAQRNSITTRDLELVGEQQEDTRPGSPEIQDVNPHDGQDLNQTLSVPGLGRPGRRRSSSAGDVQIGIGLDNTGPDRQKGRIQRRQSYSRLSLDPESRQGGSPPTSRRRQSADSISKTFDTYRDVPDTLYEAGPDEEQLNSSVSKDVLNVHVSFIE